MPVQAQSIRVKAPDISDPDISEVPVESLSTNEKATLNLSGRVGFDGPLEGSSVNYENDYYRILKFINKSKFTFTDVDNENNKGLLRRCNSKHKSALRVNLDPSDIFHGSLTHRKYLTKCDDKNINTINCSTSNCVHLITSFNMFEKLFSPYEAGLLVIEQVRKIHLLIIDVRYLANIVMFVFAEMRIT